MLGLMAPTWFLSMWISNTATTAMMIPIANAILMQLKDTDKKYKDACTLLRFYLLPAISDFSLIRCCSTFLWFSGL